MSLWVWFAMILMQVLGLSHSHRPRPRTRTRPRPRLLEVRFGVRENGLEVVAFAAATPKADTHNAGRPKLPEFEDEDELVAVRPGWESSRPKYRPPISFRSQVRFR